MTAVSRQFSVHPAIIYNLIVAQAGTLAKAVLEGIMNSIDAAASRVDIEIDRKGARIQDDGQGFRSRQEIEQWFEVFGFPHDEKDHRVYGKFGIGRGQLWSFCSTIWRTGTFRMDVDIKQRGLDYNLVENLEEAKGVSIDGTFYTPLTTLDISTFQKEIAELARFAQIPIYVNGKRVNKDPTKEKWDFDTPDAWIKIAEGGQLAVYNLGVLVRRYSAYQFGCGGVIVTKPGVRLALNMARNDVLLAECAVWKRIRKVLQANSDHRVRTKRTRMSEAELENAAKRFLAGEIGYREIESFKLITDILGRNHTLRDLIMNVRNNVPITQAERGSRLGERAHSSKLAFVLAPVTLERFDAESIEDFKSKVLDALKADGSVEYLEEHFAEQPAVQDLKDAAPALREGYDVLKDAELTKPERAARRSLEEMSQRISSSLVRAKLISAKTAVRNIHIGVSEVAEAWTDGSSRIVVERGRLKLMHRGIGGFAGLANLLVHEYLHDNDDVGSHTHDQEFYARYHDATCGEAGMLQQAILRGLRRWVIALESLGQKTPRIALTHLSEIERIESPDESEADASTDGD